MSRPSIPAPAPVPPDPMIEIDAQRRRAEKAATAMKVQANASGRRSTIVGGAQIAYEEQAGKGLLNMQRRNAARQELGL